MGYALAPDAEGKGRWPDSCHATRTRLMETCAAAQETTPGRVGRCMRNHAGACVQFKRCCLICRSPTTTEGRRRGGHQGEGEYYRNRRGLNPWAIFSRLPRPAPMRVATHKTNTTSQTTHCIPGRPLYFLGIFIPYSNARKHIQLAMAVEPTNIRQLLMEKPRGKVENMYLLSNGVGAWVKTHPVIKNRIIHSTTHADGSTWAEFDRAFLAQDEDDDLRLAGTAMRPNERSWEFKVKADCELWFHTEISNVVLTALHMYPNVLQSSHQKPPGQNSISEEVDTIYTVEDGAEGASVRRVLAIGRMKRNHIYRREWENRGQAQCGKQAILSQELRG